MSDRLAKICQLEVYRKIPGIYFHETILFRCVFNYVKLKLTPFHILPEGKCVKVKRMGAKRKQMVPHRLQLAPLGLKLADLC